MEKQRVTSYALIPAVLSPFCVMFHYGYTIGTFNSLSNHVKQLYNESYTSQFGTPPSKSTIEFLWALTASVFPLGGICGSLMVKPLVAYLGRRKTIIYNQIIISIALLLTGTAKKFNCFENVIIGRILAGVFAAIGMGVVPIYVTEISAHQIRGPIGGLFSTSVAIGSVVGHVVGLKKLLGTEERWPYAYAVEFFPVILQICYSPWMPKSPRALFIDKRDPDYAQEVLIRLRGGEDIKLEMEDLRRESTSSSMPRLMTVIEVIKMKSLRWQLISSLVIMSTLQLTGINGIQFYLNDILVAAGIEQSNVIYCSIGVVSTQVFVSLGGGFLSERCGRKTLLVAGNSVLSVALLLLTFALAFSKQVQWMCYLCVAAIILFIFGSSIGPGAVTYSVTPELFSQVVRPAAMMLGTFVLWLSFAIIAFITPYLFNILDFAAFTPFFLIAVATTLFIYFVVPETKGQSFSKIQSLFAARNKVSSDAENHSVFTSSFKVSEEICMNCDKNENRIFSDKGIQIIPLSSRTDIDVSESNLESVNSVVL